MYLFRNDVHSRRGVDVADPFGYDFAFAAPERGMEGGKLTVDVGGLHGIGIHQRDVAYSAAGEHFGGGASHSPDAYHEHVGRLKSGEPLFAEEQGRAFLPGLHQTISI